MTHFALMLLWWIIKDFWQLADRMLRVFSRVQPLLWSMCCQNALYLSFRCFNQLLSPVTRTPGETINFVVCILMLFFTVLLSTVMSFLINKELLGWMFGALNPSHPLLPLYISATVLLRVAVGFCHAYLSEQSTVLLLMLACNGMFVVVLVILRKIFLSKSVWTCAFMRNMCSCSLQCILFVEYLTNNEEEVFAALEMSTLIAIFFGAVLEFLCQLIGLARKQAEEKTASHRIIIKKLQVTVARISAASSRARLTITTLPSIADPANSNIFGEPPPSKFRVKVDPVQRQKLRKLQLLEYRTTTN